MHFWIERAIIVSEISKKSLFSARGWSLGQTWRESFAVLESVNSGVKGRGIEGVSTAVYLGNSGRRHGGGPLAFFV